MCENASKSNKTTLISYSEFWGIPDPRSLHACLQGLRWRRGGYSAVRRGHLGSYQFGRIAVACDDPNGPLQPLIGPTSQHTSYHFSVVHRAFYTRVKPVRYTLGPWHTYAPETGSRNRCHSLNSTPDSGTRFSCRCTTSNVIDYFRVPKAALHS